MVHMDTIRDFPDKIRTVLAFLDKPVIVIDRRRRILYLNPEFEKQFLVDLSDNLGKGLDAMLPVSVAENINQQITYIEKDSASRNFNLNYGNKNFRVSASPIRFKNRHAGSVLLLNDVSSESATKRFNKKIITMLLDDLQQPMGTIGTILSELPENNSELREKKEEGEQVIRNLLEDINDLMDFCSLILEEELVHRSAFSPQRILNLALKSLRPRVQGRGIFLEELSQEDLPDVIGDQAKLSRIIILLSDYFLRQIPKGEIICLSAELKPAKPFHNLLYSVTATGIVRTKIDRENDNDDFTRIHHEDKVASRRLFLMQRLVLAMDGTWATAAHETLGTTMTVSVPVDIARSL